MSQMLMGSGTNTAVSAKPIWKPCQNSDDGIVQLIVLNVPENWISPWPSKP